MSICQVSVSVCTFRWWCWVLSQTCCATLMRTSWRQSLEALWTTVTVTGLFCGRWAPDSKAQSSQTIKIYCSTFPLWQSWHFYRYSIYILSSSKVFLSFQTSPEWHQHALNVAVLSYFFAYVTSGPFFTVKTLLRTVSQRFFFFPTQMNTTV